MLPELALTPGTQFGVYLHVPFCTSRCGYCDFNTYTAAELGGATPDGWLAALRVEAGAPHIVVHGFGHGYGEFSALVEPCP